MNKETRRFRIEGRVQGVNFRASTRQKAVRIGVTGWVRNLPDGAVEATACGTDVQLREFENWLWRGPQYAKVTQVLVESCCSIDSDGFHVRR